MVLGLARWPTVHWTIATAYVQAAPEQQGVLSAVFDGLNLYLGNFVGEFVGEIGLYGFFAATALAAWRDGRFPRWVGPAGLAVAAVGAVALFRNVTDGGDPASDVANVLTPGLARRARGRAHAVGRPPGDRTDARGRDPLRTGSSRDGRQRAGHAAHVGLRPVGMTAVDS